MSAPLSATVRQVVDDAEAIADNYGAVFECHLTEYDMDATIVGDMLIGIMRYNRDEPTVQGVFLEGGYLVCKPLE